MQTQGALRQFVTLVESFLRGDIDVGKFERAYLDGFSAQRDPLPEAQFLILDRLFAEVDAYTPDPDLRDRWHIDEDELRRQCRIALERLAQLPGNSPE